MPKTESYKLTRGLKSIIKSAILETNTNNRYVLCDKICQICVDRYEGDNLEYQLERMNIETTKRVLEAIDTFYYKYAKFVDNE